LGRRSHGPAPDEFDDGHGVKALRVETAFVQTWNAHTS
jgi:hypothetical protein